MLQCTITNQDIIINLLEQYKNAKILDKEQEKRCASFSLFLRYVRWNLNHQTSINIDVGRELCHWIDRYTASISTLKQKKNIKQKKNRLSSRPRFFLVRRSWDANKLVSNPSPWKSFLRACFSFREAKKATLVTRFFSTIFDLYGSRCRSFRAIGKFMRVLCRPFACRDVCSNKIFFRRVKRFMSAIDVALDTRSLIRGK